MFAVATVSGPWYEAGSSGAGRGLVLSCKIYPLLPKRLRNPIRRRIEPELCEPGETIEPAGGEARDRL